MHTTEQLQTALAGRYAIEKKIGEGGMATVYLARDLKHDRKVALKVLKPELGAVLGVERFLSEIKVTANLQHPNLLPLFDSGEAGGLLFYVMPFVEGESLRARLEREQQLPIDEAVRISSAIASALAYAHERGVIHRDLKPENILLQSGQPVVADFGIALAVSNAGGARVTQTGLSLGTPQYMSPEQASGDRAIDARSDLYSLAAMTYEMIAGEPPHTGPNAQAIMAKLLTAEPAPLSSLRSSAPVHVELALAKALAKVPADRFGNAAEFAAALSGERAVTLPMSATRATAARARTGTGSRIGKREAAAWTVAVAAVAAAGWLATRPDTESPMSRYSIDLPDSVLANGSPTGIAPSVAVSPDGRLIAFVGSRRLRYKLYLRRVGEAEAREIPGTDQASRPVFSPDGSSLLFLGESGALNVIPVTGGTPRKLADSVGSMSWGDDGSVYFTNRTRVLSAVSPDGGSRRVVATLDTAIGVSVGHVEVLPGSRRALVVIVRAVDPERLLGIVNLRSGTIESSRLEAAYTRYVAPGVLLFSNPSAELLAAPVDGDGLPVVSHAVTIVGDAAAISPRVLDFSVSREGTVAYRRLVGAVLPPTKITLVDGAGRARVLRDDGKRHDQPIVSPDGRRAVVRVGATSFGNGDLWILDLASGAFTPLTRGNGSYRPSWSRDGKRVFFMTGSPNASAVRSLPWDGSGPESVHVNRPQIAEFAEGPRGGWSVIRDYGPRDIFGVPTDSVGTATPKPLIQGPANETNPQISPNGRLLAYTSDQSGQQEVYVTALPGPGPRVPVSVAGGSVARWSPDGSRIYYRARAELRVAAIVERPELAVTRRDLVTGVTPAEDTEFNFAVMPNGGFLTTPGPPADRNVGRISVITGWQSLLKNPGVVGQRP